MSAACLSRRKFLRWLVQEASCKVNQAHARAHFASCFLVGLALSLSVSAPSRGRQKKKAIGVSK